jgi:dienelactone hydrolase
MVKWLGAISSAAALVFLVAVALLGRSDRAGPRHTDVMLPGNVPATLYLPGTGSHFEAFNEAPAPGARPPAVVLAHGFAGDRIAMSSTARRLADAGYAALAMDLAGHGQNRNPFTRSRAVPDAFFPELSAAVDFLRTSPHVDGSRIALLGQSMGAGAALDYSTRDPSLDAVILMSGGWSLMGPHRPRNALFLFAESDPERIRARARELAARLAGVREVELTRRYGDLSKGTGVAAVEVPDSNHASIIWTDYATREILAWLDAVFETDRTSSELPSDPRMGLLVWVAVSLLLALPGLGWIVGRVVPEGDGGSSDGRALGLGLMALALALTMPLLATGPPAAIIPLEVADGLFSHLALAGIVLLLWLTLGGRPGVPSLPDGRAIFRSLVGGAIGTIGVFLMLSPLGVFLHRLSLTPERFLAFGMGTLAVLPFSLAAALLLRRGPPVSAGLYALAGKFVLLVVILIGIGTGMLASVLGFIVGPLFAILIFVELLAASIYAVSRDRMAIALIEAASLALVLSAIMPVRI